MSTKTEADSEKQIKDYAWQWFDYHARQRQQNIQFSVSLLSAALAATGYLVVSGEHLVAAAACVFGLIACLIFFGLDCRNSFLVKIAEKELSKFEVRMSTPSREIKILRATDDFETFMFKYSTAAKLMYGGYALFFLFALAYSSFAFLRSAP